MLRKIIALDKVYFVDWSPDNVCDLLENKLISANKLVQKNKKNTNKLIKDFYLLACRASLNSMDTDDRRVIMLRNYAKRLKKISNDYEHLFRRQTMKEAITESEQEKPDNSDSANNNIDRMQARLFYLTTQFSAHPCTPLAGQIVELLTKLCKHPHIELMPAQQYIYSQSLNYWRSRLISCPEHREKVSVH